MKKTEVIMLIVCLAVVAAVVYAETGNGNPLNWARLKIVTYTPGHTGFFDPDTGKMYIYDKNMEECIMIRELGKLGEPMNVVK